MLTELKIQKAGPKDKQYELSDGRGLALRVHPSGTKSWIYRYRHGGKARRLTLGNYPEMGSAEARRKHAEAVTALRDGLDPGRIAVAEKAAKRRAPTVEQVLQEYFDRELSRKRSG
ncbi:MAG: Arm DNA-binding domain-containing protein, partial [Desulfatiglandaceae bacterium]